MPLADWLAIGNLLAPAAVSVILFLHRSNARRWDQITAAIRRTNKDHRRLRRRIKAIERNIVLPIGERS